MRFLALDSLRGLAAVVVALYHLTVAGAFYQIPLIRNGGMGVSFFFVLSGFVISHAYGERLRSREEAKAFVIRRFGRLYPLHLFTLILLISIEFGKLILVHAGIRSGQAPFSGTNDLTLLLANVFLLQAVIPFGTDSWNGPSWSISTEFYTYLVFGTLMLAFAARSRAAVIGGCLLSGAALVAPQVSHLVLPRMSGGGVLLCLFGFFTGAVTYQFFLWAQHKQTMFGNLAELAAATLVAAMFWFAPFRSFGTILSFAVAIFIFAFDKGFVSKVLQTAPLQFLGKISYSIYLIHFVILSVLFGGLRAVQSALHLHLLRPPNDMINIGPPGSMDLLALAYLLVVIAVATLTYRFIEVPGRNLFNRLAEGASVRDSIAAAFPRRPHRFTRLADDQITS